MGYKARTMYGVRVCTVRSRPSESVLMAVLWCSLKIICGVLLCFAVKMPGQGACTHALHTACSRMSHHEHVADHISYTLSLVLFRVYYQNSWQTIRKLCRR